jgi:pilus assembly protein CpaB
VPENIVTTRNELLEGPEGERIAIRSFVAGEPFLKTKVSGYGEKPTLSRKVADDMRAFSIRINDVSGVAGFLLPGDRVDVMLTRELTGSRGNLITDVIIQNVGVLGIDQLSSEQAENPVIARTATVEVTPEQAQKLALAEQLGTLSLTLRNYANLESAEVKRISVSDLGIDTPRPVVRDNGIYVRVRKGVDNLESERVPQ